MTYLYELVDQSELDQLIADGRIKKQVHPKLPISIYNYTAAAQYRNIWTNSERQCRGLIVEDGTNKVIARGPSKFMNYGQPGAPETTPETLVRVTRKEDGSLGIGWKYDGHYGVATRGSFMSDQAKHATNLLTADDKANIDWAENHNLSRIWEIIYPDNRIVLDYGNRDELIPLGTVNTASGIIDYRPQSVTKVDGEFITLSEALVLPIPSDEEGYVLDILEVSDINRGKLYKIAGHVKLKGEEYKILHGLLTNTNARRIWVQLAARACHHWIEKDQDWARMLKHDPEDFNRVDVEKDLTETLLTNVPDEFYDWVTKQIDAINDRVSDLVIQSILLAGQLSMVEDKRQRWELVKDHVMCQDILRFVESRDESRLILKAWQLAKPEGDETPFKKEDD